MSRTAAVLALLLCQSDLPGLAESVKKAPWQIEQNAGVMSDTSGNFKEALGHFQKALGTVPPNALNEKIELKCQTAVALLRTDQMDRVVPTIDDMLEDVKKVKQSQKLSQYAALAVHSLADVLETDTHGLSSANKNRLQQWKLRCALLEKVCKNAVPELRSATRCLIQARVFLGMGDRQGALTYVENFARDISPADPLRMQMRLDVAALRQSLKQPNELKQLSAELQKRHSFSESMGLVSIAQTWATDYEGAFKTVDDALSSPMAKSFSKKDQYNLLYARLWCAMDAGRYNIGEQAARAILALNVAPEDKKFEITDDLITSLEKQKKMKEAAAIKSKAPHSKYDFIIDDEREAAEEIARKDARNAAKKP